MVINLFGAPVAGPTPFATQALLQLMDAGMHAQAEPQAESLCREFPRHPLGWAVLGAVRRAQQRTADAVPALERAAALAPRDAVAAYNLGHALRDLGQRRAAIAAYQRALKLRPDIPGGWFELGNLQHDEGQLAHAERSYRRAAEQDPGRIEILSNLAAVHHDAGRLDDALAGYDRALAIDPNHAVLHSNRSDVLHDLRRLAEAAAAARQAIALAPSLAAAHALLGNVLQDLGQFDESIASLRRAVDLAPADLNVRSSLLFFLNYAMEHDRLVSLAAARAYGQATRRAVASCASARPDGAAEPRLVSAGTPTRLRVGLMSGDLREHPVGHFLEGLLLALDGSSLDLVALATQQHADPLTARIYPCFSEWVLLAGLSDAQAAERVRGLGLHVVFDLSGHSAGNRLPLFERRLAPVQVSWLGYFATTGIAEMDYLLADPVTLPPSLEDDFTETIYRLPRTRLCFTAPRYEVSVGPLPALTHGDLTFGCFSNLLKVNDRVVELWCHILKALPGSRLLLKAKQLADGTARDVLLQRFVAHGVHPDRLVLDGPQDRRSYLEDYRRVDVTLDPFPFPGGTTTAESLWMGVPVLTMAGDRFIARQGLGLLVAAGLPNWVAADAEQYLALAVRAASDLPNLAAMRAGLRAQVLKSPLFDARAFACEWEAAAWGMWRDAQQEDTLSSMP